ncbi:hypothetical protein [Polaribacter porphyrae]|uniref:Peptidase A2 domain-containing protein n=1 Tax=Polaribacter porphyrae TaxID=1137780 RepID=A0A2S7WLX2_9FLAO|nr:hypothetical protein [Polaribacter porphyrae]PQJ78615.1 hypothetical protein BTO18_05170 [Polaribacter porphyrae]
MKKKIGYILLILFGLLLIGASVGIWKFNNALFKEKPNYLKYTFEDKPIHFNWAANSTGSGDYAEPQAAMTIPLKIEGIKHQFYMQFDTGAPNSYIYENDLKSLRKIGLDIKEVVNGKVRCVKNLNFILGVNHIEATMIPILKNYGHNFDKNDTLKRIGIGTIGSDFLENKITSIDFKNQKIQLFDKKPNWMKSLPDFKKFDFTGRKIMLPVKVDHKDYEFLYDSGCSAFGLITIKSRFEKYSNAKTEEIKYDAKSWDDKIPIRSKYTDHLFTVGSATLTLKRVSYVDMYTITQPLVTPFTRIGGWLGNQPFNESMLILDTKKEEFVVITED